MIEAGGKVARQRERERQRPGAPARARPDIETLLHAERTIRIPLRQRSAGVAHAVSARDRNAGRGRLDGARVAICRQRHAEVHPTRADRDTRTREPQAKALCGVAGMQADNAIGRLIATQRRGDRTLRSRRQARQTAASRNPSPSRRARQRHQRCRARERHDNRCQRHGYTPQQPDTRRPRKPKLNHTPRPQAPCGPHVRAINPAYGSTLRRARSPQARRPSSSRRPPPRPGRPRLPQSLIPATKQTPAARRAGSIFSKYPAPLEEQVSGEGLVARGGGS